MRIRRLNGRHLIELLEKGDVDFRQERQGIRRGADVRVLRAEQRRRETSRLRSVWIAGLLEGREARTFDSGVEAREQQPSKKACRSSVDSSRRSQIADQQARHVVDKPSCFVAGEHVQATQHRRMCQRLDNCHADEGGEIEIGNIDLISMCLEISRTSA